MNREKRKKHKTTWVKENFIKFLNAWKFGLPQNFHAYSMFYTVKYLWLN